MNQADRMTSLEQRRFFYFGKIYSVATIVRINKYYKWQSIKWVCLKEGYVRPNFISKL